jgi:hypothetical protein
MRHADAMREESDESGKKKRSEKPRAPGKGAWHAALAGKPNTNANEKRRGKENTPGNPKTKTPLANLKETNAKKDAQRKPHKEEHRELQKTTSRSISSTYLKKNISTPKEQRKQHTQSKQ